MSRPTEEELRLDREEAVVDSLQRIAVAVERINKRLPEVVLVHNSNGKWYHWLIFEAGYSFCLAREFDSKFAAETQGSELRSSFGIDKIRVNDAFPEDAFPD